MNPKIVFSNRVGLTGPALVRYALGNGYRGVDWHLYSPAPDTSLTGDDRTALVGLREAGLEVRFHLSPDVDVAHGDPAVAGRALARLQHGLDIAAAFGGRYATVHLASNGHSPAELSWAHAVGHLSALVEHGRERGVTVCLENLRTGWTSDPARFVELVERSGAMVTFDVGHANSDTPAGADAAFLARVAGRVVNAHVYEHERDGIGHTAPRDLHVINPLLERLLYTACDWWLIELEDRAAVERTRTLLQPVLYKTTTSEGERET